MRESEMRQRIERLLRRRMQGVLAPTLGLGLALVGCEAGREIYGTQFPPRLDAGEVSHDGSGPARDVPLYSALLPLDAAAMDAPATNETLPADAGDEPGALDAQLDVPLMVDQG